MPSITFLDLAGLYAAALHVSTEETRYYLNGVFVEPYRDEHGHGVRLVATDGHRLSVGYDPEALASDDVGENAQGGVILPVDKSLHRHLTSRKAHSAVWDGAMLTVYDIRGTPLGMAPCRPIAGTFPDWQRVVPSECSDNNDGIAFNAAYLAVYEKIARAFRLVADVKVGDPPVHITPNGEGPAWVTLGGVDNWHGVLMPIRQDKTKHMRLPGWIKSPAPIDRPENRAKHFDAIEPATADA